MCKPFLAAMKRLIKEKEQEKAVLKMHVRDENKRERERAAPENPLDPDEELDEDPSSDSSASDGEDDEDPKEKEERRKLKKVQKKIKMLQARLAD